MEYLQVVAGLTRKWADIAGEIVVLHNQLKVSQANLAAVQASIKLFQPEFDFTEARVSRKPGVRPASYGDMSKAVYSVLRGTGERWVTVRAIQEAVIAQRDIDPRDKVLRADVGKRVAACLRYMRVRGNAEDRHGLGLAREWRLSDEK